MIMEPGPAVQSSADTVKKFLHVVIIMLSIIQILTLAHTFIPSSTTGALLEERPQYQTQGARMEVHPGPKLLLDGNASSKQDAEEHASVALLRQKPLPAASLPSLRLFYPMAPYGPFNQIFGLQEVTSMAALLNRTLILPVIR